MSEETGRDFLSTTPTPHRLTMTTEDLAVLLGKTTSAVNRQRHDIRQGKASPDTLPAALDIPGTRKTIWLTEDVLGWLRSHREPPCATSEKPPVPPSPRPRGRPRKRDQLARRTNSSSAGDRSSDA